MLFATAAVVRYNKIQVKGAKADHVYNYFGGRARESKHGPSLLPVVVVLIGSGKAAVYSNITTFSMSTFKPLTTAQVLLHSKHLPSTPFHVRKSKKKSLAAGNITGTASIIAW